MNSHRAASQAAYDSACVVCGTSPCEPAHYPTHRGSGGRFEDPWDQEHWLPMCRRHHDLIDRRLGVSPPIEHERWLAVRAIERHLRAAP